MSEQQLLLILDKDAASEVALVRAAELAQCQQLPLTLLWQSEADKAGLWTQQLQALKSSDIRLEELCLADGQSLQKRVIAFTDQHPDTLLIKASEKDHKGLLPPLDWKLLRNATCPVLLVKQHSQWQGGPILVAIEPLAQAPERQALNRSLLQMSQQLGQLFNATVHPVIAWDTPMLGDEPEQLSDEAQLQRHQNATAALLSDTGVEADSILIGEGPAEHWIASAAADHKAVLLLIGTKARRGIAGALLGNTSEQLLDRVDCDLLVLPGALGETA